MLHEEDEHPSGCRVGAERATRRRTDSRTDITEPLTDSLSWVILPEALATGQRAESQFQEVKQSGRLPNRAMKHRKRKVEERLKATDPW